jgi:hypothetical protein
VDRDGYGAAPPLARISPAVADAEAQQADPSGQVEPPRSPGRRTASLLATVLVVELVYVFFISAGKLTGWRTYHSYIDYLAEGFRAGHLYLSLAPRAALLASANPFDPANVSLWYWDASLYGGHYYLYWGPLPALLLAAVKTAFRIAVPVGDQYAVFAFTSLQLLVATLLLDRMARRLFREIPLWLVVTAVLATAFANPVLYNLGRAGVYEAAIIGGHAFVLLGLLFAFDAVWTPDSPGPLGRNLTAAGVSWALALSCRVSLAPAVLMLALLTAWLTVAAGPRRWRRLARGASSVGGPLAVGILCLLGYNRLRFDRWLEFGLRYQMSTLKFSLSTEYIPANLYSYLLRPVAVSCKFPFLFGMVFMGARAFPKWYPVPATYSVVEQVIGVLVGSPWSWLAPVAVVAYGRSLRSVFRGAAAVDRQARAATWLVLALASVAASAMFVEWLLYAATMRYLGDVIEVVALLGTMGGWWLYQACGDRPRLRRLVAAGCIALAIATVAVGLALGFEGQYSHFRLNNPALLDRLIARFSFCPR